MNSKLLINLYVIYIQYCILIYVRMFAKYAFKLDSLIKDTYVYLNYTYLLYTIHIYITLLYYNPKLIKMTLDLINSNSLKLYTTNN